MKTPGLFFVFEGMEGSGKTTQVHRLQAWLESQGKSCIVTREPGGTALGQKIRSLILDKTADPPAAKAELLLYLADRAHHVETKVLPALREGKVVLSDRYLYSSWVYQSVARGIPEKEVVWLNRFATGGLSPKKVFLLDVPETFGLARVASRNLEKDRMELESVEFHRKVRKGFVSLARRFPKLFTKIDGRKEIEAIEARIQKEVKAYL